jgi:pSer/pThr/pTyr-binding forkhead associated (FHA) protein
LHCAVEVRRDVILLHDLRSTNGTYLDNSPVFAARLEEMSRFRIGSSLLQMSRLPVTEGPRI